MVKEDLKPEHPWDRQPQETDQAWSGFVLYRDLGPAVRTLAKAAKAASKSAPLFLDWSQRWDWVARCRAYDAYLDKKKREADEAAIVDMRRRHIDFSMALQGTAALALNKIMNAEKAPALDAKGRPMLDAKGRPMLSPLTLKASEVRDLAELGVKLERLNRGEPESIAEQRVVPDAQPSGPAPLLYDWSKLSKEELRALKALTTKARHEKLAAGVK